MRGTLGVFEKLSGRKFPVIVPSRKKKKKEERKTGDTKYYMASG